MSARQANGDGLSPTIRGGADGRGRRVLTPTTLRVAGAAQPRFPDVRGAVAGGTSANVEIFYDSVLGETGRQIAGEVMNLIQADVETVGALFGGIRPPSEHFAVVLARLPEDERAYHYGNDGTTLYCDVQTTPWVEPRYSAFLAATLLVDVFADAQGRGWDAGTAGGEALSRVLATSLYPRRIAGFATASTWLDSDRSDFVNANPASDRLTEATGCAVLFLNYLHLQLGFPWDQIVAAGGVTLSAAAERLTGAREDPFPEFRRLLDAAFPPGRPAQLGNDNPFPLPGAPTPTEAAHPQTTAASAHSQVTGAGPAVLDMSPAPGSSLADASRSGSWSLDAVVESRRWIRCSAPFAHVRATSVFVPEFYEELSAEYRALLGAGRFSSDIPGYDASALTVTESSCSALTFFLSRSWHDMLAQLLDVTVTGDVNVSLHHHAVGSASGAPHNDLNPGWFVDAAGRENTNVSDPARCGYRTGVTTTDLAPVERIRAIAVLYYLANPADAAYWGGESGLYRDSSTPVDRPEVAIPPVNNSLVAFECTPFSFHCFITNPHFERNSVVMWLHRDKLDAVRRWGEQSIVGW